MAGAPRPPAAVAPGVLPPLEQQARLREMASVGYYRGILKLLDELQAQQPDCQPWCEQLRTLARQYRFDAVLAQLAPAPQTP